MRCSKLTTACRSSRISESKTPSHAGELSRLRFRLPPSLSLLGFPRALSLCFSVLAGSICRGRSSRRFERRERPRGGCSAGRDILETKRFPAQGTQQARRRRMPGKQHEMRRENGRIQNTTKKMKSIHGKHKTAPYAGKSRNAPLAYAT